VSGNRKIFLEGEGDSAACAVVNQWYNWLMCCSHLYNNLDHRFRIYLHDSGGKHVFTGNFVMPATFMERDRKEARGKFFAFRGS
jgi:hypothetical protein